MEMCYDGALVMPNNCVVMNSEEMTYVEAGCVYISYDILKNVALAMCINPLPGALLAVGYVKLCAIVSAQAGLLLGKLGSLGGPIGAAIGFVAGALTAASIATTYIDALWARKGIEIGFTWRPTLDVK